MSAELTDSSPRPLGEIAQGPGAFELFLDRNQKNLVILAILLVIAAAALIIYRGIERGQEEAGGAALTKAEDLPALQSVVKDHPETAAAGSAMVLLANRQWTEGQQDASLETLRKFLAEMPEHPGRFTAKASLGSKLMAQGKTGDATKIFEELSDDPSAAFIAPFALVSLGDLAKTSGDNEKAEAFYNRARTEFPESNFAETATTRIALLKAKPPVEVAPPAPPAGESKGITVPPMLAPNAPSSLPPVETPPVEIRAAETPVPDRP